MKTNRNTIKSLAVSLIAATAMLTPVIVFGADETVEVPTREDMIMITVVASVTAIDQETRDVTLQDEFGKEVSFRASEAVERLDEISVGDRVEADYYLSLAFELREPTAEELENPLQIDGAAARADMDVAPGAGAVGMIKAVCTIEGIDRPTETVTLMGPLGGLNVVRVADVDYMPNLHIGQSVVVTFTEALVIALDKVAE